MSSHSPLRRTSVRSGSSTLKACSWKVSGVAVDLLGVEHRPQRRAPGRVPHPAGEVADDQHHVVAGVLELAQLLQHDRVSEVDVGRGRVDPELHPQRPPLRAGALELSLQLALRAANRRRFAPGIPRFCWDLSWFFARRPMLDSRLRSGWP